MSLEEVFANACPYYIHYGMTYDQFWNGDVCAHRAYREAYKLRKRDENLSNWMMGRYVYDAVGALAPLLKAFAKGRAKEYVDHPYDIFQEDREAREEKEAKERYERIKRNVEAFVESMKKKQEQELTPDGKEVGDIDGRNDGD